MAGTGKTAVVVGAGPAGLTAALVLARHNFKVLVFEKAPQLDRSIVNQRSFFLHLDWRSRLALKASGVDMTEIQKVSEPSTGLRFYSKGRKRPMVAIPLPPNSTILIERYQLLNHIFDAADRQFGNGSGAIQYHWGQALSSLDTAAKLATFQTAAGDAVAVEYDLLLGADGVWSKVREALEQQVPGFTTHIDRSWEGYIALDFEPSDLWPGANEPVVLNFAALDDWANPRPKEQPSGELSFGRSATGRYTMHMALHREGMRRYRSKADYLRVLSTVTVLPLPLREAVAEAFAGGSQFYPGASRVKCSQLHGPGVVLLGDAGHATTEKTGQGCNSAMEDTLVLDRVLQETSALADVPEAFTQARLVDVHALYAYNCEVLDMRGRRGVLNGPFLKMRNHMLLWGILHKLLPRLVEQPQNFTAVRPQYKGYKQTRKDMDAHAVATLIILGVAPPLALAIVVGAVASMVLA